MCSVALNAFLPFLPGIALILLGIWTLYKRKTKMLLGIRAGFYIVLGIILTFAYLYLLTISAEILCSGKLM